MTRMHIWALLLAILAGATEAAAQAQPTTTVRGFGDFGYTTFAASESFTATLGAAAGAVFGAGGEVVLPQRIFFGVRVSRFKADGERVFISDGERFGLGIPMTVTIRPILLSAGYRFGGPRATIHPYVGGGIGWHRYQETSEFAEAGEDVDEVFRGYHVLGGAEYRVARLLGIAGEAQWATVPDALGQNPSGVSAAFDETDLGGFTVRVKVVVGR
jgi:opacity protein-like surface antigen